MKLDQLVIFGKTRRAICFGNTEKRNKLLLGIVSLKQRNVRKMKEFVSAKAAFVFRRNKHPENMPKTTDPPDLRAKRKKTGRVKVSSVPMCDVAEVDSVF